MLAPERNRALACGKDLSALWASLHEAVDQFNGTNQVSEEEPTKSNLANMCKT